LGPCAEGGEYCDGEDYYEGVWVGGSGEVSFSRIYPVWGTFEEKEKANVYRLVSIARGEQQYFDPDGIPTATEGCKSNALMRCCKDLGIASELWDPRFIRTFTKEMTKEVWVEHVVTKKKKKVVIRKDDTVRYPFKATA
jgi:hypothetical protein